MNDSRPFNLSIFEKPPGLFFEHKANAYVAMSHWNLIAYIDLDKFRTMFSDFEHRMISLKGVCSKRFEEHDSCNEWVDTLESKIGGLRNKFEMISPSRIRNRRAVLDFLGNMIGDVFGIMDSRSKQQYMRDLSGLLANDEHLLKLVRNQTSVVEKTFNILRNNDEELSRQNEQFVNFTRRIDKTMDEYAAASFFNDAVAHMVQRIQEFDAQIEILLETIFDSRKHHINHNLFPPSNWHLR